MASCHGWTAWRDRMPGHRTTLHVIGECTLDTPGLIVDLRRSEPPPAGAAGPVARGPGLLARSSASPVFEVDPGMNRFYALELATDVDLFDRAHAAERTAENFYGTWQDGQLATGERVQVPDAVWRRFSADADLLFYRIVTSARADRWSASQASVRAADARDAPFLAFADPQHLVDDPERLVLNRIARRAARGAPSPTTTATVRYFEKTDVPYRRLVVLPDGVSVDIDEVF